MYTRELLDSHNLTDRSDYSILSELVDGSPAIPAYSDSEIDPSVYQSFSFDYPCSYSSVLGQNGDHPELKEGAMNERDTVLDSVGAQCYPEFEPRLITNIWSGISHSKPVLEYQYHEPYREETTLTPKSVSITAVSSPPSTQSSASPTPSGGIALRPIGSYGSLSNIGNIGSLPPASEQPPAPKQHTHAALRLEDCPKPELKVPTLKAVAPQPTQMKKTGNAQRNANGKAQYKFVGAPEVVKRSMQLIYRALRSMKHSVMIPGTVMDALAQQTDTHVHILSKDRKLFHWLETSHSKEVVEALLQIRELDSETRGKLVALLASS